MTISSEDIAQVRRMIAEPTTDTYSDVTISGYLVTALEDKYSVAGEIWAEKAATLSKDYYNFSADGSSYSLGDAYVHAIGQARYYNSKRLAKTSLLIKDPVESDTTVYGIDDFAMFSIVNDTSGDE
jgi:hypothetical protein